MSCLWKTSSFLSNCRLLVTGYNSSNSKRRENYIPYQAKHVLGSRNVEQPILRERESREGERERERKLRRRGNFSRGKARKTGGGGKPKV